MKERAGTKRQLAWRRKSGTGNVRPQLLSEHPEDKDDERKIRSVVNKLKRDCEETVLKEWGAGSNCMRDPVPDLPKKS